MSDTKRRDQCGPNNPNWKGGRTITADGYVLVKDRDNPMADARGYVYEHRRVVSEREGRPLVTSEQVHHEDEVKDHNTSENLELCASVGHHRYRHRRRLAGLRLPGETNPVVLCACGCGDRFARYDGAGRPRRYVSGHNPMAAPTTNAILDALMSGPQDRRSLAVILGIGVRALAVALSKLKRQGRVEQAGRGVWCLRGIAA